jgi:hypothetical protein
MADKKRSLDSMKLNRIFIALLGAFLLTSPQIMLCAAELEDSIAEDIGRLGEDTEGDLSRISAKDADRLATEISELKAESPEAYEKVEAKFGQDLAKSEVLTEKIAAEQEEAVAGVKEEASEIADEVKEDGGTGSASGAQEKTFDPEKGTNGYKSLRKSTNESATDLLEAQGKNIGGIQKQMNDELDELDSSKGLFSYSKEQLGYSDKDITEFKNKIKNAPNKTKALEEYRAFKEDMANRKFLKESGVEPTKISKKLDSFKELKGLKEQEFKEAFEKLSKDDQLLFKGLKSNENIFEKFGSEDFAKLKPEDLDEITKYVDDAFADGTAGYRKDLTEKLDGFYKDKTDFLGIRRNYFGKTDDIAFSQDSFDSKLGKIGRSLKEMGGQFATALKDLPLSLFNAIVFMIPNLIQSAITGGEQKKANVLQWAKPVEFGGKVYQIPDKCLKIGSVNVLSQGAASYTTGSIPVYVQIPVSSENEGIGANVQKMFGSTNSSSNISGPNENSAYYNANRYTINPAFYDMTDIVVSYGGVGTGTSRIFGSEFSGQIISLKTGLVTDASGESVNVTELPLIDGVSQSPAVPLIPVTAWGNLSIPQTSPINGGLQSSFEILPTILVKLEAGGINNGHLYSQFDTSCLNGNGALSKETCSALVIEGLEALQGGLNISAQGTVTYKEITLPTGTSVIGAASGSTTLAALKKGIGSSSSTSVTIQNPSSSTSQKKLKLGRLSEATTTQTAGQATGASTWTGLGSVIPVFGWGTGSSNLSSTIIGGFDGFTFTPLPTGYAADDSVYVAQGCWVYLCANTPFINKLVEKFPSLRPSVTGSITDYIVFMDADLNIVPLMVPKNIEEKNSAGTTIWKRATLTINPVIEYWTSLVFYNDDYMVEQISGQKETPIMFRLSDPTAKPIPDQDLGYLISKEANLPKTAFPGLIPIFLNNGGAAAQQPPYPISQSFKDIYNQIDLHKQALLFKLKMLFNINNIDCNLKPSSYKINVTDKNGNVTTIPLYSGAKCFGSAQNDLLIALNVNPIAGQGAPLTLPDDPKGPVECFASLITDIVYQVDSDGNFSATTPVQIAAQAAQGNQAATPASTTSGFAQSPLELDANNLPVKNDSLYEINQTYEQELSNLSAFIGATDTLTTTSSTKKYAINKNLIQYVQQARIDWLAALADVIELGTGENAILCNLVNEIPTSFAQSNNFYVYELNPTPSITYSISDYFVVIDGSSPSLDSLSSLKKLTQGSSGQVLLSLISGTLYSLTDGSALNDSNGNPLRINIPKDRYFSKTDANTINTTADIIYDAMISKYKALPKSFVKNYKQLVDTYNNTQAIATGSCSFGKYKIAIRTIDAALGNYVYFNLSDLTKYNVKPKDMYVILDQTSSGYSSTPVQYDSTKDQVLMSLITGITVDKNGVLLGQQKVSGLASIASFYNSVPFIVQNFRKLTADYQVKQEKLQAEIEADDKAIQDAAEKSDKPMKIDIAIATVIRRLQPVEKTLPAPFVELQQDLVTDNYVRVSPTSTSGELIYQFMDTGKVYNYAGAYIMQLSQGHLQAIRDQLGVVVDSKTKKQKLGIPQFQPSLRLSDKDASITPGQSGDDMVAVGGVDYKDPSFKNTPGYGLFYNKTMETYYVLDTQRNIWMSVAAGHVYEKDGTSISDTKTVATFTSAKSGKIYPLLLDENGSGYMQGYLPDGAEYRNLSTSNQSMSWLGLSGEFNQYTVTTDATTPDGIPTKYKVNYGKDTSGKNQTRTFTVNEDYSWQQLALVPIDKTGQLLKVIPDSSYRFVELVQNKSNLEFVIYNGSLYKAQGSKGMYTLTAFNPNDSNAVIGLKILTGLTDKGTGALYAEITNGKNVYSYGYMPKIFDTQEQEANRSEIIKGVTVGGPVPVDVGPMKEVSVKVGSTTVKTMQPTVSTHVIFASDLPMNGSRVAIKKATKADIANPVELKTNPKTYSTFVLDLNLDGSGNLGNGVMKTSDGRFVYELEAQTYTYILEDAYVDLKNGALFDASTGLALGIGLIVDDFTSVLDQVGVCVSDKTVTRKDKDGKDVVTNPTGKNMLLYRGVIKQPSSGANS